MSPPPATLVARTATWTLALDESGQFERGSTHRVIGGVLLPGSPEQSAEALAPFRAWCEAHAEWPVHANKLGPSLRQELRAFAQDELRRVRGVWLFVVADSRDDAEQRASLGAYVRMLGAATDLAGRLVSYLGGTELHLRPAQRTIALDRLAQARGLVGRSEHAGKSRAMSEAETRATLDGLLREPSGMLPRAPEPGTVRADAAAAYVGVHPGIPLADVGCNALYKTLDSTSELDALIGQLEPCIVTTLRATASVRALDRALRASPPSLVSAADQVARLESDSLGAARNAGDSAPLRRASFNCAALMWRHATDTLATVDADRAATIAWSLAGAADAQLRSHTTNHVGLARALTRAWSSEDALAQLLRSAVADRPLSARLWRCTLEVENLRGDVDGAARATEAFDAIVAGGRSLPLLAEEFVVRNLMVVSAQNALPCSAQALPSIREAISTRTAALIDAAESARSVIAAMAQRPPAESPHTTEQERELWHAAGRDLIWASPDRELGMSFGTVARSLAFLGLLDEALETAFSARALFGDSEPDLRMNAAVIAHIEIERARLDPTTTRPRLVSASLALSGASALAQSDAPPSFEQRPADRLSFDILLRALLWAPSSALPSAKVRTWLASSVFLDAVSRGPLRTHPSELIARHAAELLQKHRRDAPIARRWLQLSMEICARYPPDSTLARMGAFTERLRDDPTFAGDGPSGSVMNPSFEHR